MLQDAGQTAKGRRASDRGAYSRFTRAVAEAEMTRFIKADLNADRFSWSVDEDAVAKAELFDGKLALITNARTSRPPRPSRATRAGRYRARLPRPEIRYRDRARPPPAARPHPLRPLKPDLLRTLALVLYRVMRMRLKAKGHAASPRTALDFLERIQQQVARIGPATKTTLNRQQPEQLDLFDALDLKTPF